MVSEISFHKIQYITTYTVHMYTLIEDFIHITQP